MHENHASPGASDAHAQGYVCTFYSRYLVGTRSFGYITRLGQHFYWTIWTNGGRVSRRGCEEKEAAVWTAPWLPHEVCRGCRTLSVGTQWFTVTVGQQKGRTTGEQLRTPDEVRYVSVPRAWDFNEVCLEHGCTLVLVASKHQFYGSFPMPLSLLGLLR
jgi:hypothetical protein